MSASHEIAQLAALWAVKTLAYCVLAAIVALFACKVYAALGKMAKRIGLAAMALLGLLSVASTISGTPTLEDKERSYENEMEREIENRAWAEALGFGTNAMQGVGGELGGLNSQLSATNYHLSTTNCQLKDHDHAKRTDRERIQ